MQVYIFFIVFFSLTVLIFVKRYNILFKNENLGNFFENEY